MSVPALRSFSPSFPPQTPRLTARPQLAEFAPQFESAQPKASGYKKKNYASASSQAARIQNGQRNGALLFGGLGLAYGMIGGPIGMATGAVYGAAIGFGMAASLRAPKNMAYLAAAVAGGAFALLGASGGGSLVNGLLGGLFGAFNGYQLGGFYASGGLNRYLK